MILLDELDVNEKDKRDSLPPYSPQRSLKLPSFVGYRDANIVRSSPSSTLHPRSASLASANYAQSQSSLTLNSNASSQTLLVRQPPTSPLSATSSACGPSTSQLSVPLPAPRIRPPSHLRASNNVFVQRDSAAITGTFLVDPALQVPDCLLPDDPDVLYIHQKGVTNGKEKQKKKNLCLVTRSGDICVDIWIREGCATQRRDPALRRGRGSSIGSSNGSSSYSTGNSIDSSDNMEYWKQDWTSPPPSLPWPEKTKECVDIDIRSETGSITVRIHAQSHQRLRIHVSSARGSIAVGVPRTFAGYVQTNANNYRSDSTASVSSFDSVSSLSHFRSVSTPFLPGLSNEKDKERLSMADELVAGLVAEISQALPTALRQAVQFSSAMEGVVTALSRTKSARGRYLICDAPSRPTQNSDELHLESYLGTMGVFYNDEYVHLKSDGIITKFLNKAR